MNTARLVAMKDFIDRLESLAARRFPTEEVDAYLRSTIIEPGSLEPYMHFREDRYCRNLVRKTATFECLVICWAKGQNAPIHGHEGERCWARVERGKLRFTNYREKSTTPLVIEQVGDPADGGQGYLDGPADIHRVENVADFGEDAASLHVYSYPYGECDIYDPDRGVKERVTLKYDTTPEKPRAVDS